LSGAYRLFGRFIRRDQVEGGPSYLRQLTLAFSSTVVRTMSLAVFLAASYLFLDGFSVLRADIAPILEALFGFIWFVYFVASLTDQGAHRIGWAVIGMAAVNGLDYFLGTISQALNSPLILTIARSLIASSIIAIILIALSFLRPVMPREGDPTAPGRPWPRFLP